MCLIEAAASLLKNHPRLHFDVAGEGPQRAELTRLIEEHGIGQRFRLGGAITDVPTFLDSLDIAVLPSRSEGMSNALLEAMAAGRAIVATRVGATEQLIRDGVDGLLVEPGNPNALAAAMAQLLKDSALARRIGASARRRVSERFSRDVMRQRFEEFYHWLIHE